MSDDYERGVRERQYAERQHSNDNSFIGVLMDGGGFMKIIAIILVIVLIVPIVLTKIFEWLFIKLFKFGIVGRIIHSAVMAFIAGFFFMIFLGLTYESITGKNLVADSQAVNIILACVFFALVGLWCYFSHYFTQKTYMYELDKGGMFLIPFCIIFLGWVIMGIIESFVNGIPFFLFAIPPAAAVVVYVIMSLGVREEAKELKDEEGLQPLGAIPAVILACVLPFLAFGTGDNSIRDIANYEAKITAVTESAKADATAVITDKNAYMLDQPSIVGNVISLPATLKVKGMELKVTGEAVSDREGIIWIPVEFNGQHVYILPEYVRIKK